MTVSDLKKVAETARQYRDELLKLIPADELWVLQQKIKDGMNAVAGMAEGLGGLQPEQSTYTPPVASGETTAKKEFMGIDVGRVAPGITPETIHAAIANRKPDEKEFMGVPVGPNAAGVNSLPPTAGRAV